MHPQTRLDRVALANTFVAIDIVLHIGFHIWVAVSPGSYEHLMALFVAGLRLDVTDFDVSLLHILQGTVIEAVAFWLLGFVGATIYNRFAGSREG